jgi:hypothetical protein
MPRRHLNLKLDQVNQKVQLRNLFHRGAIPQPRRTPVTSQIQRMDLLLLKGEQRRLQVNGVELKSATQ